MFLNTYENSLDAKGRCIVPAKFRDDLGNSCVIVKFFDDCLYIYTKEYWLRYTQEHIESRPDEDLDAMILKDDWYAGSQACEVDKQGRITIRQDFLDHANITKEIVNVGQLNRIKVWSKENYDEMEAQNAPSRMKRFASMNKYNPKPKSE